MFSVLLKMVYTKKDAYGLNERVIAKTVDNESICLNEKLNIFIHQNLKKTISLRSYLYYIQNVVFGILNKNTLAIIGTNEEAIKIIYSKYYFQIGRLIKDTWPNSKVLLRYFYHQNDILNEMKFDNDFIEKPKAKVVYFNEAGNKYTFDNFVSSEENITALKISQSLACYIQEELVFGGSVTCIYGSSSTGKTHLVNAITNFYCKNGGKVFNTTANNFLCQYVKAVQDKNVFNFQDNILQNEIIIIDDVDDLIGKNGTLDVLKKILSVAIENKKYVVLTASQSPKKLLNKSVYLDEILSNAISWELKEPKEALKNQVVMNYICEKNLNVPISIVRDLVKRLNCNIRELKNYVKKLAITQSIRKFELNTNLALSILSDDIKEQNNKSTISNEEILSIVASYYSLTTHDLCSNIKCKNVCKARNMAMFLMKKHNSLNFQEIGRIFNRNHSTVILSIRSIESSLENDKKMPAELADLMEKIKNK